MSSHREAPQISKDPVADNTDLYAFVSAGNTVTIIANYLPLELPAGGPNFFEFGEDVLYQIAIDNDADGAPEIIYSFQFATTVVDPSSFLYNVGPISAPASPGGTYANLNRYQSYTVTRLDATKPIPVPTVLASKLLCPPCNIGPRSTPNYAALAQAAVYTLPGGGQVFAGQRADGFYVDLGSVFDLADLRPFENLHLISTPAAPGVNGLNGVNVHSIAIQLPIASVTSGGVLPTNPLDGRAVLGIWASASRRSLTIREASPTVYQDARTLELGPWVQVSRLGNPLVNEVIIPMGRKDQWNATRPSSDAQYLSSFQHPSLAQLLPKLYPGVFLNLAAYSSLRADLVAILLTGIPPTIIPGFQNYTGPTYADQLRLNVAIPPASSPNIYGVLGGDLAGYPNGRRVFDDVTTIEIRAVAGVTIPLVDPSYTPDGAAGLVSDFVLPGTGPANVPLTASPDQPTQPPTAGPYLASFPYLGVPFGGYSVPPLPATPNSLP